MNWFTIIYLIFVCTWLLNGAVAVYAGLHGWHVSTDETKNSIAKWSDKILNYPFDKMAEIKDEFFAICKEIKRKTNETFENKTY